MIYVRQPASPTQLSAAPNQRYVPSKEVWPTCGHSRDGRTLQESSISAVRIERTVHPVPQGDVSAGQRDCVVRDRIELSTFRFSGQPR
jgi:hypothetical protein